MDGIFDRVISFEDDDGFLKATEPLQPTVVISSPLNLRHHPSPVPHDKVEAEKWTAREQVKASCAPVVSSIQELEQEVSRRFDKAMDITNSSSKAYQ